MFGINGSELISIILIIEFLLFLASVPLARIKLKLRRLVKSQLNSKDKLIQKKFQSKVILAMILFIIPLFMVDILITFGDSLLPIYRILIVLFFIISFIVYGSFIYYQKPRFDEKYLNISQKKQWQRNQRLILILSIPSFILLFFLLLLLI
ncbi:hypothetical protein R4Y45_04300 [Holzapfeliella sp. He02]|uniref:NADH dehydrogenase subunit 2 n=1 Tax=Holzapfeliella saturejae TaxID=3082953 RepID=A0ABU8SGS9_9LACO